MPSNRQIAVTAQLTHTVRQSTPKYEFFRTFSIVESVHPVSIPPEGSAVLNAIAKTRTDAMRKTTQSHRNDGAVSNYSDNLEPALAFLAPVCDVSFSISGTLMG